MPFGVLRGIQTRDGYYVKATPSGEIYSQESTDSDCESISVTVDDVFQHAVARYGIQPCMATRSLLGRERKTLWRLSGSEPTVEVGLTLEKLKLGEYICKSYNEVAEMVRNVGINICLHGIKPRDHVMVFAETRAEWMIAVLGCL